MGKGSVARQLSRFDVGCAISQVEAARWLLDDLEHGNMSSMLRGTDTEGWLRGWAIDALGEAVKALKAAQKHDASKAVA